VSFSFFRFDISSIDDNIDRFAPVIGTPNMVWQSWLKLPNPRGLRNLETLTFVSGSTRLFDHVIDCFVIKENIIFIRTAVPKNGVYSATH